MICHPFSCFNSSGSHLSSGQTWEELSRTHLSALESHVSVCTEQKWGWTNPWKPNFESRSCWWRCGVLHLTIEHKLSNRERGRAGGKGVRVSDSGIRQLVQAAWLEADLIVHLSSQRHLGAQVSSLFLRSFFFFLHFSKVDRHHKVIFTILDCCFATIVLVLIYLPWHCCRDGGLLEELPLSAFCLQKEGWVVLTERVSVQLQTVLNAIYAKRTPKGWRFVLYSRPASKIRLPWCKDAF